MFIADFQDTFCKNVGKLWSSMDSFSANFCVVNVNI